jgi:hypothetical protein
MRGLMLVVASGGGILALMAVSYLVQLIDHAPAQDKQTNTPPPARPDSQTSLFVRGWNQTELGQILTDYFRSQELPELWRIAAAPNRSFMITFPDDIGAKLLFRLVNYIRYPNNTNLSRRPVGVLGHLILTPEFDVPDPALLGKRAVIYVPGDDAGYNLIYAKVESGSVYKIHL